jgi:hypothetical protein
MTDEATRKEAIQVPQLLLAALVAYSLTAQKVVPSVGSTVTLLYSPAS